MELLPTIISACVSILICVLTGYFGLRQNKLEKKIETNTSNQERRYEQRKKESLLAMKLTHANTELIIGVAMALKNGHANGEIEKGLLEVAKASEEYNMFLTEIANDHLQK